MGAIELHLGNYEEAVRLLGVSIEANPKQHLASFIRGIGLHRLGRLEEALDCYDLALALNPDNAEVHTYRNLAIQKINNLRATTQPSSRSIDSSSGKEAEKLNELGISQETSQNLDHALASFDRAIALEPDYAEAHYGRGRVLLGLDKLDDALTSFDCAIALKPDYAEAYNARGRAFHRLKRLDEALANYDRAIALKPDFAKPHWNTSLLKLLTGDFDEGWRLHEWRWKGPQREFVKNFPQPLWLGQESIADKVLLIHAEQGFGDVIQFCRYLPMVEALGANVVLWLPTTLVSLTSAMKRNFRTVTENDKSFPAFDFHCPFASFPLAFRTTLDTIPAEVPYLFADPGKREAWRKRLGPKTRPRVGLVWSGRADHPNDRNRSIPLKLFKPLLQLPIELHSLQKDIRPDDSATLSKFKVIQRHQDDLDDFSDTSALIQEMDLVISVDTSVAHLAGALGQKVWILLPFMPDFRWMLDRSDSPWYPTATLFRQSVIGDWSSVISDVAKKLEEMQLSSR
jgi:hypothetical protein